MATAPSFSSDDIKRIQFFDGTCLIGSTRIRCTGVKHHHAINQVPVAEISLGLDTATSEMPATMQELYSAMFSKSKGDEVIVAYMFSASQDKDKSKKGIEARPVAVFKGVLLGWAPVWIGPKSFKLVVWAIHPLGMLDWTSSMIDAIHGSGFDDYTVPTIAGKAQELVPYMKGAYSPSNLSTDMWKSFIKPELVRLCGSNRAGKPNCKKLVEYLNSSSADGSEQPLSLKFSDTMSALIDIRRRLYFSAIGRRSLWDALVDIANAYKFSILCRSTDYSIAPTLMALGGAMDPSSIMYWSDFANREEYNSLVRDVAQSTGMLRGLGGVSSFFDSEARKRQTAFGDTPDENMTVGVDYFKLPSFMDFDSAAFVNAGKTMGLKEEQLFAAGYKVDAVAKEIKSLNSKYNASAAKDLSSYEAIVQNDRSFSGPTVILRGNINYNVSPGNTVVLEPPMLYQPKQTIAYTYVATVWGVSNVLESSEGYSMNGTYAILSHVRSFTEQAAIELERHPMYDKRWISAPLTAIAGYTEAPKYA